jgi:multiple antibiotic resistance protein
VRVKDFWLAFVPLFVAVDVIGVLPLFLSMTHNMEPQDVRRIVVRSIATAAVFALFFAAAGPTALKLLGITVLDFMVAGGALLLALALRELLAEKEPQHAIEHMGLGVVPLGVPLVTGPAVLTTSILLVDQYGLPVTGSAIAANMLLAGLAFRFGGMLRHVLGSTGTSILSKVANLFLAAIGVMMVRRGVEGFLAGPNL